MEGYILLLEGNIGVGKTTLCSALHYWLKTNVTNKVIKTDECVKPALLSLYLKDKKKYALAFQLDTIAHRKALLFEAAALASQGYIVIMDRGVIGDLIFCSQQLEDGNLTKEEYAVYLESYKAFKTLGKIYTIVLEASPEKCYERMLSRGNEDEVENYTLQYFQSIGEKYQNASFPDSVRFDWNFDKKITEEVCEQIYMVLNERFLSRSDSSYTSTAPY